MVDTVKLLVYILAAISTVLIFRTLAETTPATSAYILNNIATLLAFSYAYFKTKDNFWLIMLASVPPMIMSDLYFIPSFGGVIWPSPIGMNTWAGIHLMVISIGCFFYFKKSALRYVNLTAMFATILTNMNFSNFSLARGGIGMIAGLVLQAMVFLYYMPYYGISKKKFVFSLGSVIQFIGIFIAAQYFFNISQTLQPITLTWTDKIIAFGRGLLAIGAL